MRDLRGELGKENQGQLCVGVEADEPRGGHGTGWYMEGSKGLEHGEMDSWGALRRFFNPSSCRQLAPWSAGRAGQGGLGGAGGWLAGPGGGPPPHIT
jgi:hypothetical protein